MAGFMHKPSHGKCHAFPMATSGSLHAENRSDLQCSREAFHELRGFVAGR